MISSSENSEKYNLLKDTYFRSLKQVFGTTQLHNQILPLVDVRITHNSTNLTLNSCHREILYTIEELYSPHWSFKESIFGKALICLLENVNPNPDFSKIGPIYKKHYMIRMNLIISQYNNRFDSNEWKSFTPEKKTEYLALKQRIRQLKLETIFNQEKMNSKISKLDPDIQNIIYQYCCENIKDYLNVRSDMETYRNNLKAEELAYLK